MRKFIISIILGLLVIGSASPKDLFTESTTRTGFMDISTPDARFLRVTDVQIDTISVYSLLPKDGFSLICFSENWCEPSYREFNRLYNDSIIEYLKKNNTRLIVLAEKYPFLNVNRLDSIALNNIESDFEIYYYANSSDRHIASFPCIWLIDSNKRVIYQSLGLKDDYRPLKDKVEAYIKHRCRRCKGTGQVKPNRHGGPDESVGICPLCGGKGRL